MKRLVFVALFAFLLSPACFGEALFERGFQDMGYESLLVTGPEQRSCLEVVFVFPEAIEIESSEIYPIASLGLEFGPVQEGKTDIRVWLNDMEIARLETDDFKCAGNICWERLPLLKSQLREEENTLKVCARTGNSITRILLSNGSKVGLYKTADFTGKDAFVTVPERTELVIGEKTEITILLCNGGSAVGFAEIKFARPLAEDKEAFTVVEGSTYFKGDIGPGETVQVRYVLKPRVTATMTLPPAIVYYKNEFGEQESMFSNLVSLNVSRPESRIEAFILKEKETGQVGEWIELRLAVKNTSNEPIYDIGVEIDSEATIVQEEERITSLQPKETRYVLFRATSSEPGVFGTSCKVGLEGEEGECETSFVEFKQPIVNPTLYVGLIFIGIAVIVYIYITRIAK